MFKSVLISIILCVTITNIHTLQLPKEIKRCSRSQPDFRECLGVAITQSFPYLKKGIPELEVEPLDPLKIPIFRIDQGQNSPIMFTQVLKNVSMSHILDTKVNTFNVDFKTLTMKTKAFVPRVELIGDYEVKGRILLLPIVGSGRFNVTLVGMSTYHEMLSEPMVQNNQTYIDIKKYNFSMKIKRLYINFENLFGDKALSDQMNIFLNQNWDLIFSEVRSSYEENFGKVFHKIAHNLFIKVPMDDIFLP